MPQNLQHNLLEPLIMDNSEYKQFKSSVLHLQDRRFHKITNSLGVYDAYKYIRKNKWFDIGRPITEHEFYQIVRRVSALLAEGLSKGEDVMLPCRMGMLELRKRNSIPSFNPDGSIKVTYAIDWDRTLKLWYEDEGAFNEKTLVKIPEKNIFRVRYNKETANYENKGFMDFQVNRDVKMKLKHNIKNNQIDAFSL